MGNDFINKLKWRSIRRSLLEVDLIFNNFINSKGLECLLPDEVLLYEELIEMNDNDLLLLFNKKIKIKNELIEQLINKILYMSKGLKHE